MPSFQITNQLVNHFPELRGFDVQVQRWEQLHETRQRIMPLIKENPGIIQSQLYKQSATNSEDGRAILYTLEKAGKVKREKSGRSYALEYGNRQNIPICRVSGA